MKKKINIAIAALLASALTIGGVVNVFGAEEETLEITRLCNQFLYLQPGDNAEIIEMYEEGGWVYNAEENYLVRTVTYENAPLVVDGEEFTTDDEGSITLHEDDLTEDSIEIASLTGLDEIVIDLDDVDNDIVIVENISVNTVMKTMDTIEVINSDEYDGVFEIGQNDGDKPNVGDVVACNRFNGYCGNGKYYSNQFKPQAITNFYASDCDWALGSYANCLLDEQPIAKYRYCSLVSETNYGRCSALAKKANGKSHSKYFHMHSGYKS